MLGTPPVPCRLFPDAPSNPDMSFVFVFSPCFSLFLLLWDTLSKDAFLRSQAQSKTCQAILLLYLLWQWDGAGQLLQLLTLKTSLASRVDVFFPVEKSISRLEVHGAKALFLFRVRHHLNHPKHPPKASPMSETRIAEVVLRF